MMVYRCDSCGSNDVDNKSHRITIDVSFDLSECVSVDLCDKCFTSFIDGGIMYIMPDARGEMMKRMGIYTKDEDKDATN